MDFFKNIISKFALVSLLVFGFSGSLFANDIAEDLFDILVNTTKDITLEEVDVNEDTTNHEIIIKSTISKVSGKIATLIVKEIAKDAQTSVLQEQIEKAIFKRYTSGSLSKLGNLGKFGVDVLVGVIVDVTAETVKAALGGEISHSANYAAYVIQQTKVIWAAKKGIHYAVLEQTLITTGQLYRVVELHNELINILDNNEVQDSITKASSIVVEFTTKYKSAKPCPEQIYDINCKEYIENEIRWRMRSALVIEGGIFTSDKTIVGAEAFIDNKIDVLKESDKRKYNVVYAYIDKIKSNPEVAHIHGDRAKLFIDANFYNDGTLSSSNEAGSFKLLIDRALASVVNPIDDYDTEPENNEKLSAKIYLPSNTTFNSDTRMINTTLASNIKVNFSVDYNNRFPEIFNFKHEQYQIWYELENGDRFYTVGEYDSSLNGLSFVTNTAEKFKLLKMGIPRVSSGILKYDTVYFPIKQTAITVQDTQQLIKNVDFVSESPIDDIVKTTGFTKTWNFSQDIEALGLSISVLSNSYSNSVTPSSFAINGNNVSVNLTPNTNQDENKLVVEFKNQDNEIVTVSGSQTFYSKTISKKPVHMVVTCNSEIYMEENFTADIVYNSKDSDGKIIAVDISVHETPKNGTIRFNNSQPYYEPNDGYNGTDSFKLKFTYNGESEIILVNATINEYIPPVIDNSPYTVLSANYLQNEDKFQVNWDAKNTDTLEILYSYNQTTWTRFGLFTLENYAGSTNTNSISNSKNNNKIYFKSISTKDDVSVTSNWLSIYYTTFEDNYVEKATEVPTTPTITTSAYRVSRNNVTLTWKRVNDSLNNDNVNFYEILFANNSSFNNASVLNAGNNAAGVNIYEGCSYNVGNLQDNNTYYFKIRANNNKGTSSWSGTKSIQVELEDMPYFKTTGVRPDDGDTFESKTPLFKWDAEDDDGDELFFKVEWGESPTSMTKHAWVKDGTQRFDMSLSDEKMLKPNTKYYWQISVREDGHYSDYYGGEYIKSPIRSFTTIGDGSDLAITDVELVTELIPDAKATLRVTVKNIGNETADDEWVTAYYKKGDNVSEFRAKGSFHMQNQLEAGESEIFDLVVQFDDALDEFNGRVYDNILVEGDSYIILDMPYLDEQDVNPSNNVFEKKITYVSKGKPEFSSFYLVSYANYNNVNGAFVRPHIGTNMKVGIFANDDLLISKATIEYKITASDSWHLAGTVTNDDEDISAQYNWNIPSDTNFVTDDAQIRVRVYENDTSYTEKISYAFPIVSNVLDISIDSVSTHQVGDTFYLGNIINSDYPIRYFRIKLYSNGTEETLYYLKDDNKIDLESLIKLSIPHDNRYANEEAYFEVEIKDIVGNRRVIQSNNFNLQADTKLSGTFGNMIDVYNTQYNYPAIKNEETQNIIKSTENKIESLVLDDNNIVHMIIAHKGEWWYDYRDNSVDDDHGYNTEYLYLTYNIASKSISSAIKVLNIMAPDHIYPTKKFEDFKIIDGIPNVITFDKNGNKLLLYTKNGSSFSTQTLSTDQDIDNIEFIKNENNYYVHYRKDNDITENRRHTLKLIYPNMEEAYEISPNEYLGGSKVHFANGKLSVPYRGKVYSVNNDLTVNTLEKDFGQNSQYILNTVDLGDKYIDVLIDSNDTINFIDKNNSLVKISDFSNDYNLGSNQYTRMSIKVLGDIGLFVHAIENPVDTNKNIYNIAIVDLETKKKYDVGVGTRIDEQDVADLSSINNNKFIAIGQPDRGSAYLAVADFSKDVVEPQISFQNTETFIENTQSIILNWNASDNDDELIKYEVYKIVDGNEVLLSTINNIQTTTYTHTISEGDANLIEFKVKAYDNTGNIGYAILPLQIMKTINFSSFSVNKSSLNLGEKVIFSWSSDGSSSTKYTIYKKKVDDTTWSKVVSTTGETSKLYIVNDFVGSYNFKIVSGNNELVDGNVVSVNGEILKFNNGELSPQNNYYSSGNIMKLQWSDTLSSSVTIPYSVWIKKQTDSDFIYKGDVLERSYEYFTDDRTPFTWKVTAEFDGKLISSEEINVVPINFVAPVLNNANFEIVNNVPTVNISFTATPHATSYTIQRWLNGNYENIATTTATTFADTTVQYGKTYTYKVLSKRDTFVSEPSLGLEIEASYDEQYGVIINNANYQTLSSNTITLSYQPNLGINYEAYEILLGKSVNDMKTYVVTRDRDMLMNNLDYATTYFVEIYPIDYNRVRLSSTPSKLTFTTGFDSRVITEIPVIGVQEIAPKHISLSWNWIPSADEYYICRSDNNAAYDCFTKVTTNSFNDTNGIASGSSYRYKIVAINDNSNTVSEATHEIITGLDDATKVMKDTELLNFGLIKLDNNSEINILTRLNLVSTVSYGSSIYWASSDFSILDSSTGTLHPTDTDTQITLIATINYGDAVSVKIFNLVVKKMVDADGDGVSDYEDAFPNDPAETTDTDNDGIGNNADLDDDNDGMSDIYEELYGLNALYSGDANEDNDQDGYTNLQEYNAGTNPELASDFPRLFSPSIINYLLN